MNTVDYLKQNMKNPPNASRPVQIIHHYFPHDDAGIQKLVDLAVKNELGGFCINMDVRPAKMEGESDEEFKERSLNEYLGEDTPECKAVWDALPRLVDACIARGLKVWIYDERAFPSGGAGNKVLKSKPDSVVKGLLCVNGEVKGGRGELKKDRGTLKFAAAYPIEKGLVKTAEKYEAKDEGGDVLVFDLPDDGREYKMVAFYTRPLEFYTVNEVHYVDLMRADVTDEFIKHTHEKYLKYLGPERMSKIVGFFTDEPGLPTHGCSHHFTEKDPVAAWTEEMDGLLPYERYTDIFFDTDRDFGEARRIWWNKAGELYAKNYFGRIDSYLAKYGSRMTGHLYGEETLSMQIGLNADLFGLFRYMSMPGVDRLYCYNPRDVIAEKTCSSAAHLYGKKMTMSENSFHLERAFWNKADEATDQNRLNSDYYQKQMGITNPASYFDYYRDEVKENRIEYELKSGRTSFFITTGTHKTDVLVLIPMNAAYSRFAPPDHKYWEPGPCTVAPFQPQSIKTLENAYGETLFNLEDGLYDFDLIDERGLADCTVKDGKIYTKYESFKALVVFDSNVFFKETDKFIEEFLKCGGHVTAIKTDIPNRLLKELSSKYPSQIVFCNYNEVCEKILNAEKLFDIDVPFGSGVRVRKTETEDADLYYVHNRKESDCDFTVPAGKYTVFDTNGDSCEIEGGTRVTLKAKEVLMFVKLR
ncbi:MAG: hypothetical protein II748_01895 [Clostridia bacterium]|nr:hypothetical protein [Clostridia bacterium]